jgi:hypothetical protein
MIKFKNDLRQLTLTDYQDCLNSVIELLNNCDWVNAIYSFGTINHPSVSDIDLLIVLINEGDFEYNKDEIDKIVKSSNISRYCFWHEPLVLLEQEFKYIRFFHTAKNLKCLYKNDNHKNRIIPVDEDYQFLLQKQLDIYYFMMILDIKKMTVVSKRWLLLVLNNLGFSLKANNAEGYVGFQNRLEGLRNKAVNNINTNIDAELTLLVDESVSLFKQVFKKDFNAHKINMVRIKKNTYLLFWGNEVKLLKFRRYEVYLFPFQYAAYLKKYKKLIFNEIYFPLNIFYNFKQKKISNLFVD